MRSLAIAHFLAKKPYRKFYLINQDYAFGHAAAEGFAGRVKRALPDAQIVGEDYHPLANQDFGPYISKILAAKPEVIFTGTWGPDLVNLINQARARGVKVPFLCYYLSSPTDGLKSVKEGAIGSWTCEAYMETVRTPANKDFLLRWSKKPKYVAVEKWPASNIGKAYNGMRFMMEAIKKAGTLDIPIIIKTWEGMKWKGITGPMTMRAEDHQALIPLCIAEIVPQTNEFYPVPYVGEPLILSPEKTTVPLKETGCHRKKGQFQ
jgi:ABC-type branched-subunit amino acid transport system substrate-binding protein